MPELLAHSTGTGARDGIAYPMALLLGAAIGYLQVSLGELALSALAVSAATMALGVMFPRRPWRWALLVALCVPAALLAGHFGHIHFTRGAIYGSFALLMPALACACGGSFMRRLLRELFRAS